MKLKQYCKNVHPKYKGKDKNYFKYNMNNEYT